MAKTQYRIPDDALNKLIDIRDSMDALEGEIEKTDKMVQAWRDADDKKKQLEKAFLAADAKLETAIERARNDPDWSDLHKRAVARWKSLKETYGEQDVLTIKANKHAQDIASIIDYIVHDEKAEVRAAEAALRAQLEHMKTPGKLACKVAYDRLIKPAD